MGAIVVLARQRPGDIREGGGVPLQVVQERPGEVRLLVVKGPRFEAAAFEELLATLREYLGHGCVIQAEFVDVIPMVRTGKRPTSLSAVKIDYQEVGGSVVRPPDA